MKSSNRKELLEKILKGNPQFDYRDNSTVPYCDECDRYKENWVDWNGDYPGGCQICVDCFIEIVKEVRS